MGRQRIYDKGRWSVERERGRISSRIPPPPDAGDISVGDVIPALIRKLGLEDRQWLDVLAREWPKLVGEGVAKHTRPGRAQRGVLTVFVDSSVWLSELSRYGKDEMLAKLQKRFGKAKIASIVLRMDPDGSGGN